MRVDYDRPLTRAELIALLAHFAGSPYRDRLEQIAAHDAALRASNAALRGALRHAARELQYVLDADPCEQGVTHQSGEALACVALAKSLLGPMRDWPEEPNASMSATLAAKREDR